MVLGGRGARRLETNELLNLEEMAEKFGMHDYH